MAVKPIEWMRRVRDAKVKVDNPPTPVDAYRLAFTGTRLLVLLALALRLDADGTGYASTGQLAEDARADARTVRRATAEARKYGYLNRTRRGHRLGSGQGVANEWELICPDSQPVTGDPLRDVQPVTGDRLRDLNRTEGHSQPVTGDRPRGLSTRGLPAAARAQRTVIEHTEATDTEAAAVVALIEREKQPRSLPAFVARLGADGELPDWLGRVRAERGCLAAEARRRAWPWCDRCGTKHDPSPGHCACETTD